MLTLTVEELNEYVRRTLAADPMLRSIRLRGELSNFKRHVSGHWYFTLKDSQSAISCAMFRSAASTVAFQPRDGQQVVLYGSVGLYAKTGQYQFYADGMEPDGLGELYLRFEALKARLMKEGLFDASLKKPLPLLPKGIGIATSKTGAVIHDIARVTWRRNPGMPLYLYPVKVQGEGAAEEIVRGLRALDRLDTVDVLIVGRGGGSMEDLWPFNEEIVVRAIAACHKPVISAVGHETDFTIADFVADVRAATPSAAAEMAVSERESLLTEVLQLAQRMKRDCEAALAERGAALSQVRQRLAEHTPERQCRVISEKVTGLNRRMVLLCETALQSKAHSVREAAVRLCSAGPGATLARGYALVRQQGHTVQSVEALDAEQEFSILWRDGSATAKASAVQKEEHRWL